MSYKDWKKWNRTSRRYRRDWMRRWRSREENRLHEQAMDKLREAVRYGVVEFKTYMNEVRQPGMVRFRPCNIR